MALPIPKTTQTISTALIAESELLDEIRNPDAQGLTAGVEREPEQVIDAGIKGDLDKAIDHSVVLRALVAAVGKDDYEAALVAPDNRLKTSKLVLEELLFAPRDLGYGHGPTREPTIAEQVLARLPGEGVDPDAIQVTIGGQQKSLRAAIMGGDPLTPELLDAAGLTWSVSNDIVGALETKDMRAFALE